jgi:hypothetical protein
MSKFKFLLLALAIFGVFAAYRLATAPEPLLESKVVMRPQITMEMADPAKVATMERLLEKAKAMPASSYVELPNETTPTESKLLQVLAYLQTVRPTDGGSGPTGAKRMGGLIKDAADQYGAFLKRRMAELTPKN